MPWCAEEEVPPPPPIDEDAFLAGAGPSAGVRCVAAGNSTQSVLLAADDAPPPPPFDLEHFLIAQWDELSRKCKSQSVAVLLTAALLWRQISTSMIKTKITRSIRKRHSTPLFGCAALLCCARAEIPLQMSKRSGKAVDEKAIQEQADAFVKGLDKNGVRIRCNAKQNQFVFLPFPGWHYRIRGVHWLRQSKPRRCRCCFFLSLVAHLLIVARAQIR